MTQTIYTVKNATGLHARPCAMLAKALQGINATIIAQKDGKEADLKQAMKVLKLQVAQGDQITIIAEGEEAEKAFTAAVAFLDGLTE